MTKTLRLLGPLVVLSMLGLSVNVPAALAVNSVVTNCTNDSQLSSAIAAGGSITFNCGVATIVLTSTKTIALSTTINGADKITLSGGGARRLFVVNAGASLDLVHIVLNKGNGTGNGGAIDNQGFLALDFATIKNSTATANGGAIYSTGSMDITGSTLFGNSAPKGGAIYATGSRANETIASSSLHDNKSTGANDMFGQGNGGGAIFADAGAHVYVYSTQIFANTAEYQGGAIHVQGQNTYLFVGATSAVRDNTATGNGNEKAGGIFNSATVDLSNMTVTGNITPALGGGIYNYGTLTLTNVTMSGNRGYLGGAIANSFATMTLTNVTLANNGSTDSSVPGYTAFGGAIATLAATANLTNVTIAGNRAGSFGGLYDEGDNQGYLSTINLRNVLLSNNTAGSGASNCSFTKPPATNVANLSTDATCGFGAGHDNIAIALGLLENNGGFTPTMRLLPGSAAINVGSGVGAPSTDQRGIARPQAPASAFDVGAVEYVPCNGVPTTKPTVVGPALGTTVKTQTPTLDWYGPDCATSFKVMVRRGSPTGTIVLNKTVFPTTQLKTGTLVHGVTYYWLVKACVAAGCLTGTQWSFKVK